MRFLPLILLTAHLHAQSWTLQTTNSKASLRGVSAVDALVAWASGTGGTYLKTTDGGVTWTAAKVPGAESLDFRDIQAFGRDTVYLLSSGSGDKARIYKTTNGGTDWKLQFTNPDPKGFFDAFAFWDADHGIAVGDPVDGQFVILTTSDGGATWLRRMTPPSVPNEGAFAASGTCLITFGKHDAWFATGGPGGARVFHSSTRGLTWTVAPTPIRNDTAASGVFSLAFSDGKHGVAVGGEYSKPTETEHNIAITSDGGKTWSQPKGQVPHGFRSAVGFLPGRKAWIAVGTSGSDISTDGGQSWKEFDTGNFNAFSFSDDKTGWAVGPQGRIALFK